MRMVNLVRRMTWKQIALLILLVVAWSVLWGSSTIARAENDDSTSGGRGAVYSLTNAAAANAVAVFDRANDGSLRLNAYVFTGGKGTGANLGSQQALVLEKDW